MNDDEIVQSALHDFNGISSSEETKEPEEKISCDIAYVALQTCLSFLEEQLDVTLRELMMVGAIWQQKKKKIS